MPPLRALLFFGLAFTVPALALVYVGLRLIPQLRLPHPWTLLAWTAMAGCYLAMPAAFLVGRITRGPIAEFLQQAAFLVMGLVSFLIFLVLLRDLAWLLLGLLNHALPLLPRDPDARDRLLGLSGPFVVAVAFLLVLLGVIGARRDPVVERVSVSLRDLPAAFEGYRIVQISDLHVSAGVRRPFLEKVVADVAALQPDLVAITGDLVDGSVEMLADDVAPLSDLRPPDGVFFVTGNHEYYSGSREWTRLLSEMGIHVLDHEHRVLRRGEDAILVAGVPDLHGSRMGPVAAGEPEWTTSDPAAALKSAPPELRRILLAHQPGSAFAAEKAGFDLMLCGHTHAGQFWPWTWVPRLQPFSEGLHVLGKMHVYTNRGTGSWGPPLRLGSRTEITRIELRRL